MRDRRRQKSDKFRIVVLGLRGFPGVPGGIETHCEHLYSRLAQRGFEVIVFCRAPYMDGKTREYRGVRLEPLASSTNKYLETIGHTFLGVWTAMKWRPDILHIHGIGPAFFVPLARALGMRVVMTHHGPDYKRKKWGKGARLFLRAGEYLGVKCAHRVIAVSEFIAGGLRERFRRDIDCIPNGIEVRPPSGSDGFLKEFGLRKGGYILSVGRFVPEKGFHDLLAAFERAGIREGKLVFVGEATHRDTYAQAFEKKARENPSVVLTGFLSGESLRQVYENAGLFVLPSYYEGLPLVLLEALSHGVSCLASSIPANEEIALSPQRYFEPGDVEGLSRSLARFFHEAPRSSQQERQRESVSKKYDWSLIARATEDVYRQLSDEPRMVPEIPGEKGEAMVLSAEADPARGVRPESRAKGQSEAAGRGELSIYLFHEIFKNVREIDPKAICPHHAILVSHFRQFVEYHLSRGYRFASPDQILRGLAAERYVLVTFDDSYASNLRLVPLLKEYGIPAVFFISTHHVLSGEAFWWDVLCRERMKRGANFSNVCREMRSLKMKSPWEIDAALAKKFGVKALRPLGDVDRPLSPAELKAFAKEPFVFLGNHTRHHAILTRLSSREIKNEVLGCQEDLGVLTGQRPEIIAYPNGDYDKRVLAVIREAGIKLGVTVELLKNYLPILPRTAPALRLGRFILSSDRPIADQCRQYESVSFAYWRMRNLAKKLSRWPLRPC